MPPRRFEEECMHCRQQRAAHLQAAEDVGWFQPIRNMGGCQNYGPLLGPYYNTANIILGTQTGPTILRTTHMSGWSLACSSPIL